MITINRETPFILRLKADGFQIHLGLVKPFTRREDVKNTKVEVGQRNGR